MVDVSAAAAAAAIEQGDANASQVVPEQYVQQFEDALATGDANAVEGVEASAVGDRMLEHLVGLDKNYQELFPNGIETVKFSELKLSNDGMVTEAQLREMLTGLQEANSQAMKVSLWATHVNLVTTMVGKSTQGVQTLFKNSG